MGKVINNAYPADFFFSKCWLQWVTSSPLVCLSEMTAWISSLCLCFVVSDEHLMEFVENQDHVVVLAALQSFLDSPKLLQQAMKTLLPLTRPGKYPLHPSLHTWRVWSEYDSERREWMDGLMWVCRGVRNALYYFTLSTFSCRQPMTFPWRFNQINLSS